MKRPFQYPECCLFDLIQFKRYYNSGNALEGDIGHLLTQNTVQLYLIQKAADSGGHYSRPPCPSVSGFPIWSWNLFTGDLMPLLSLSARPFFAVPASLCLIVRPRSQIIVRVRRTFFQWWHLSYPLWEGIRSSCRTDLLDRKEAVLP